jgi:hypothetical protein
MKAFPRVPRRSLPILSVVSIPFILTACATGPATKTIAIDSDPQGVRVEVNGEDLGKTPTSYTVKTNPAGEFVGSFADAPLVEFTAYPLRNSTNLHKQVKTFSPNGFFRAGDRIPARIFFDLHQKPQRIEITPEAK